jgi:hypothetical protein
MRLFFHADDDGKVARIYARGTERWARLTIRDGTSLEIHLLDGSELVRRIGGELGIWWAQRVACEYGEKGV